MKWLALRLLWAFVLILVLAGCSKLETLLPRYSDNAIERIHLVATDDVNQSSALAVDIVFIYEEALVAQLTKYTARKWFDEKTQFQLQYPGKLVIFNYELVPISQPTLIPKKEKSKFPIPYQKAFTVMVYANYIKESADYTLDISPYKKPTLTFGKSKVTVVESSKS